MTRVILLLFLVFAVARFLWRLVDGIMRAAGPASPGARGGGPVNSAQGKTPASVKMLPCPVCGTYVVPGKAISVVRGGAPVYFCSEKCRAEYRPQ
jgi:YHS domain-containing protein